jgi:UDP-glucose 4-epimerase
MEESHPFTKEMAGSSDCGSIFNHESLAISNLGEYILNVLITGGAGFIGANLAGYHIDLGDSVWVIDNLSSGTMENIAELQNKDAFRFSHYDILDWVDLSDAVAWADRIYHMAAIVGVKRVLADPRSVMATNVLGTERLFKIISEVNPKAQVLLASTSEVYGFNPNIYFSETDDIVFRDSKSLRWCYAVTKLADEYLAGAYARNPGLKIITARLFNTIGPHQTGRYGWVVPSFIKQALKDSPITVYGDGSQTRSFCDVRDTIQALDLLCSTASANGEIVNVGNDHEISIFDLAQLIKERVGSKSPIEFISYMNAYGVEFEDILHRRPVLSKLERLTGFRTKWTLVKTLDDLIRTERKLL